MIQNGVTLLGNVAPVSVSAVHRRRWRILAGLLSVCLLAAASSARAGAEGMAHNSSLVEFGDGLALRIPRGWKIGSLSTAPISRSQPPAYEETDSVSLLLHARPEDGARPASLSVVRDERFSGSRAGSRAKAELAERLREMAAAQGYSVTRFSSKGGDAGPCTVLLGEVEAVSPDAGQRVLGCLVVNRSPRPSFRLFFQRDATDLQSQREFDAMVASVTTTDLNIADLLAGRVAEVAAVSTALAQPVPQLASKSTAPAAAIPQTMPDPGRATDLMPRIRSSLVLVEGDAGAGSGFACRFENETWMITNTHVLGGNSNVRFAGLDGKPIALGDAYLAVAHDVCRIRVSGAGAAPEVMADVDAGVKIGDEILVPGNLEGAGVIKPLHGRVVGLGPNLIEVDAPFARGNSGSPIIHKATGRIIGVATYLLVRRVDGNEGGKVASEVRRFGYRLDSIKAWEPVNWSAFYAQAAQMRRIEDTGAEFQKLAADYAARNMHSAKFSNSALRRAVETYEGRMRAGGRVMSVADLSSARRQLLADLRNAARLDTAAFGTRGAYDYFRRLVSKEQALRDDICAALTKAIETAEN